MSFFPPAAHHIAFVQLDFVQCFQLLIFFQLFFSALHSWHIGMFLWMWKFLFVYSCVANVNNEFEWDVASHGYRLKCAKSWRCKTLVTRSIATQFVHWRQTIAPKTNSVADRQYIPAPKPVHDKTCWSGGKKVLIDDNKRDSNTHTHTRIRVGGGV